MTQAAVPQGPSLLARVLGAFMGFLGGLFLMGLLGVLAFAVPRFIEIFEKFEIKGGLPVATQTIISVSLVVRQLWPAFGLLALAALVLPVLGAIRGRTSRGPIIAVVFGAVSIVFCLAATALIVTGLFLPLTQLIEVIGRRQ